MENRYLKKLVSNIKDTPEDYKLPLKGIAGTLVIFMAFCIVKLIILIVNVVVHIGYLKTPEMFVYTVLMLAVYLPADAGLTIAVIVLFFKKNILFRKLFVIDTVVLVVSMCAAFVFSFVVFGDLYETAIIHSAVAGLWVIYLYVSKRVKNTFIYPHADFKRKEMIKFQD